MKTLWEAQASCGSSSISDVSSFSFSFSFFFFFSFFFVFLPCFHSFSSVSPCSSSCFCLSLSSLSSYSLTTRHLSNDNKSAQTPCYTRYNDDGEINTSPAGAVAKYCDEYVCVCVCLSARISPEPHARSLPIFVHVVHGRGWLGPPPAARRRCDTLCTSGFVDDIMFFFYNGPYSGMNFATTDRFRLNILIYTAKSDRIQLRIIKAHNFDWFEIIHRLR